MSGRFTTSLSAPSLFAYTPSQVLEKTVGFDAATYTTSLVLWQTLGYSTPPPGAVLTGIAWPAGWGPRNPKLEFPDVRLNLFLQAKRPVYCERRPKTIKKLDGVGVPLWAFRVTQHQQKLLEVLSATT